LPPDHEQLIPKAATPFDVQPPQPPPPRGNLFLPDGPQIVPSSLGPCRSQTKLGASAAVPRDLERVHAPPVVVVGSSVQASRYE
jgi:hypothetical protein